MELTRDEIKTIIGLLEQVVLPVNQTEQILLPIIAKLRRQSVAQPKEVLDKEIKKD